MVYKCRLCSGLGQVEIFLDTTMKYSQIAVGTNSQWVYLLDFICFINKNVWIIGHGCLQFSSADYLLVEANCLKIT